MDTLDQFLDTLTETLARTGPESTEVRQLLDMAEEKGPEWSRDAKSVVELRQAFEGQVAEPVAMGSTRVPGKIGAVAAAFLVTAGLVFGGVGGVEYGRRKPRVFEGVPSPSEGQAVELLVRTDGAGFYSMPQHGTATAGGYKVEGSNETVGGAVRVYPLSHPDKRLDETSWNAIKRFVEHRLEQDGPFPANDIFPLIDGVLALPIPRDGG